MSSMLVLGVTLPVIVLGNGTTWPLAVKEDSKVFTCLFEQDNIDGTPQVTLGGVSAAVGLLYGSRPVTSTASGLARPL